MSSLEVAATPAGKRWSRLGLWSWLGATMAWALLFIVLPFFLFFIYSFWRVENEFIVRQYSLTNYIRFFSTSLYPILLWNSIQIALGVSALTFILGYPLALFISRKRGRAKAVMYMAVIIPLLTSYIVRIYAMRLVLGSDGVINSLLLTLRVIQHPLEFLLFSRFAIFVTLCVILAPFMVMPIYTSLEKIPKSYIEASRDLGSSEFSTFWRIIFPLSLPGVIAGFMFVFILSLGDFLTPIMVGGTTGVTISKVIQEEFGFAYNWPMGSALSTILLFVALAAILASSQFGALREI